MKTRPRTTIEQDRRRSAATVVDTGWLPSGPGFIGASWFAPNRQTARRSAVLIVPGITHEERMMYEGLAALARSLAASGLGSLLIDLHGTAQASGRLDAADIGDRWRQDIRSAIDHLRAGGFDAIVVVGVRLGALLARSALAGERLAGFVAWAPVLCGRRHVRELRMLNASGVASAGEAADPATVSISVGAHDVPNTALAHLATLRFNQPVDATLQPTFILGADSPEGTAGPAPAAGHAAPRIAAEVQRWLFTPQELPIIPEAAIQAIGHWCQERDRLGPPPPAHASRRRPAVLKEISLACDGLAVRERTVRFGRAGLAGILSEPLHQPSTGAVRLLATLVGPGRIFPTLARDEALRGKISMRFDFAGFSSSGRRRDGSGGELYSPRKRDDIADAVACLARLGHHQVILAGFCAGGWSVIQAGDLPNVAGVVAINAQLYRQPDYRLRDLLLRRGHPLAKALSLLRRVGPLTRKLERIEQRRIPTGLETGRWLQRLDRKAVAPLLIYSEDDAGLAHLDRLYGPAAAGRATPKRPGVRRLGDRIAIGRYGKLGHSLEGRVGRARVLDAIHGYFADVDLRLGAGLAPPVATPPRRMPQGQGTRLAAEPAHWEGLSWAHSR